MARFYADEQYPLPIVQILRSLGHNVLTVQDAGNAGLSDEEVLAFATCDLRIVLTLNRRHFVRLHQEQPNHSGIIVCSQDCDWIKQATKIHQAISEGGSLTGQLIRVYK